MTRFFGFACLTALVGLVGLAHADNHHNAQTLLGKKLNTNGKHVLHTAGEHTAHAHVKGGKIVQVEVIHKTKGAVTVTKYKSGKKHFAQAEPGVEHHYVGFNPDDDSDDCGVAITYVGWGYRVGNAVIIYWFPVEIVFNGFTGAVLYVP